MRLAEFNLQRGLALMIGPWKWTAVPAASALGGDEQIDVHTIVDRPTSWLLLKRDSLDVAQALELEITPGQQPGVVTLRVLRSSGRVVAEGTARRARDGIDFEVEATGVRVGALTKRRQPTFRGTLRANGRLRLTATELRNGPRTRQRR